MSDLFTVEEVNLMCIFDTSSRKRLIEELNEATVELNDDEMLEIASTALDRLSNMSDEDFNDLELYPVYEDYYEQEV